MARKVDAAASPAAKLFSASQPPSTVERDAVHVRGLVAREVERGVGDVGSDPGAALRDDRAQTLLERVLGEVLLGQRRPDQAGADRVDADPGRGEVASQALRQADDAVLRRRVGRAPREPDQAADGGDVHDRAAAALAHPPRGGLAAVERAAQVDGDHVVPLVGRHRVDVADLADAGAVDEDVDAAFGRRRPGRPRARRRRGSGRRRWIATSPARSKPVTRAPSRAKRSAISRPIPLAAPVTSTTRFSSIRPSEVR